MKKWLVLLRGINVSGQKKIIMSELRQLVEATGFQEVQTYIQSGNLIFTAEDNTAQKTIEQTVKELVEDSYGYQVGVFVVDPSWLKDVADQNPYLAKPGIDQKQLYLGFLDQIPEQDNINRLQDYTTTPDQYTIKDQVIYLHYANGAGKSKLTNNLIEAKLKVRATMRNWNTVKKLIELGS